MPVSSRHQWLVPLSPLIVLGLWTWAKLICFSVRVNIGTEWFHSTIVDSGDWLLAVSALASLLFLLAPLLLLKAVPRFVAVLFVDATLTTILLADLMYFRFFDDVLTVADLPKVTLLPYVLPGIRDVTWPGDALYYVDVLAAGIVLPRYARAARSALDLPRPMRLRLCVGMYAAALLAAVPAVQLIWTSRHDLSTYATVRRDVGTAIGVLPYHLYEAVTSVVAPLPGVWGVDESDRRRVNEHVARRRQRRPQRSSLFGVAKGKNVILISAESLQAFPLELEADGQPIMPNLRSFARESLNFVRFYDQTNLGTTADAEFMAMQSLYPLPSGCVWYTHSGNAYRAVPTILSEQGYATVSACGTDADFMNFGYMHNRYGVQQSYFNKTFTGGEQINGWLSDADFFRQMAAVLETVDRPFMAFLLSSSGHNPFDIPETSKSLKLGELEGTRLGKYLHAAHYFDRAFGEFIRRLRETGLLDESVVAVYGDHQAFLGNPPELGRLLGFDSNNIYDSWFATKRVPFLIRLPGGAAAGPRDAVGGHLDMAPTLLGLLGVSASDEVLFGRDLAADSPPLVVFRDGSFITDTQLFINRRGTRPRMCFDTSTKGSIECAALEPLRREALERLAVSDLVIAGDLIPTMAPASAVHFVRLAELPPPQAYSAELGLEHVVLNETDLDAHPPSGATFSVPTDGNATYLLFTPSFHDFVPREKTDGVTFEVRQGGTQLYQRHILPTEPERPLRLRLLAGGKDSERISFVTKPGPSGNTDYDWALWRKVQVVMDNRR